MGGGHHPPCTSHSSQRSTACAGAGRAAASRTAASCIEDRGVSAVYPPDAGDIPDADGQSAVCHGLRAWLSRQPRPLPPPDCLPPAAAESRGVSTSAHAARRTGTNRLGPFRISRDRPGTTSVDGVRHGAELLASDLPTLFP